MKPMIDLVAKWRKKADEEPRDPIGIGKTVERRVCANQLEAACRELREAWKVRAIDEHRALCVDPPFTTCRCPGSCTGQLVADAFDECADDITPREGELK